MNSLTDSLLISLPEIAELSRVRRPVVTTWRRRHADFPQPTEVDRGRPLFDVRQVVDWLVDTGRADRAQIEPELRLHLLSCLTSPGTARTLPGTRHCRLPPAELVGAITALICLRHLDNGPLHGSDQTERHALAALRDRAAAADPHDELLRAEIDAMPTDAVWLAGVVDELVEAAWGCPQAYERILVARKRFNVPALYADAVTPELVQLIVGLCGAREHGDQHGVIRVADPAAGPGDLLMAVRDELSEDATPVVVAAEADPFLARIARRRLVVHGVPVGEWRVDIADRLDLDADPPDALVVRLPYHCAEERGEADPLGTVAQLTASLAPGQTAVVLGPAELLVDGLPPYRRAFRTRNELLDGGRVEAVIKLPGGLVPFRPGYQTALWVLRNEAPVLGRGPVLVADVSDRSLTGQVAENLIMDVVTWRRDGHRPQDHLRAYASQMSVADLVRPRRPLVARRPSGARDLMRDGRVAVAEAAEISAELHLLAGPRPALRAEVGARDESAPAPTLPIDAWIRAEQLVQVNGARIAGPDIGPEGHHPVLGRAELTGRAPVGSRRIDRGILADRYPRVKLTEPGDVVITLAPGFGVHHDVTGFSVVEYPAKLLRIPPTERERLTPRVLGALLEAAAITRTAGAVRPGTRLADLQIPVLSPADVAGLDELLGAAEERRVLARRELARIDELCRLTVSGLTEGKLTMTAS